MDYGLMFLKAIDDGSSLAVLATRECDIRQVAFEMTRLVERVGAMLSPAARTEIPQ
jgi:predicted regulator of Ras-like GTPase activity (Roadblock/LC7/MglB family)